MRNGWCAKRADCARVFRLYLHRNPGVDNCRGLEQFLTVLAGNGVKEVINYYDMDRQMKMICDHNEKLCDTCGLKFMEGAVCPHKERKRNEIRKENNRLYEMCQARSIRYRRKKWDLDTDAVEQEIIRE